MSNIIICGVDPGYFGSIVKLDPIDHTIQIEDMPVFEIKTGQKTKKVIDHVSISNILNDKRIAQLYIEEVNAMPNQGVVSMWNMGRNYGTIFGVCGGLMIPISQVRPAVWKSALKCPADKDAARYRASQLLPSCSSAWKLKKHDGRAEASLLCIYAMSQMGYKIEKQFTLVGEIV